jgi:hypothetical protein
MNNSQKSNIHARYHPTISMKMEFNKSLKFIKVPKNCLILSYFPIQVPLVHKSRPTYYLQHTQSFRHLKATSNKIQSLLGEGFVCVTINGLYGDK